MRAAACMIALAVSLALPAAHAQDGATAEASQVAEELRQIREEIEAMRRDSLWAPAAGLALAGVAVLATAVYAYYLRAQGIRSDEYFTAIEGDMRDRKRPRLAWEKCVTKGPDMDIGRRAILLTITNAGDVGATGVVGHVAFGMARSPKNLGKAERQDIRMGALRPNASKTEIIPVEGEEKEDAESGYCFRFRVVLRYSGVGNVRFELVLVGALMDRKVEVTESTRPVKG